MLLYRPVQRVFKARLSAKQACFLQQAANSGFYLCKRNIRYRGTRDEYEAAAGSYLRQERSYGLPKSAFHAIAGNCVAYLLPNCEADPDIITARRQICQNQ